MFGRVDVGVDVRVCVYVLIYVSEDCSWIFKKKYCSYTYIITHANLFFVLLNTYLIKSSNLRFNLNLLIL